MIPKSAVPEIRWPAIPDQAGALQLAIQRQLRESEWLAPDPLEALQLDALRRLLRYAVDTVPRYRDVAAYAELAAAERITPDQWRSLPVLTRPAVQEAGDDLRSDDVPHSHLPLAELITTGSTGAPVRALATSVTNLFWRAITLRQHLWHRRDLTARLAAIRADLTGEVPPDGLELETWGPSTATVYAGGPCGVFSVQYDVARQAEWLVKQDPDYLLTYPSNLMALAQHFAGTGPALPRLREACTYGEALTDDLRPLVREVWDVDVVDTYSAQEVGYIALQCPKSDEYHVQAETVYVEVLDEHDQPCPPGEVGRIVLSTLHNYAMPLLRYEIGDYAEVGPPCSCGRGLPVLRRILGRQRNMWVLPGGQRVWPLFGSREWGHIDAIRQLQLVQHEVDRIEARIVGPRPLSDYEEMEVGGLLRKRFDYPFHLTFTYLDRIDRTETRKFEDFVCRVRP
ncbi:MAG: phenylacetate--CoA ligase family protein [Actinomycetota bacterium]|nr:phenylacetate--CoA ligase family protein [Actinomycetota bacterium]